MAFSVRARGLARLHSASTRQPRREFSATSRPCSRATPLFSASRVPAGPGSLSELAPLCSSSQVPTGPVRMHGPAQLGGVSFGLRRSRDDDSVGRAASESLRPGENLVAVGSSEEDRSGWPNSEMRAEPSMVASPCKTTRRTFSVISFITL
jgi:hypothetical protein